MLESSRTAGVLALVVVLGLPAGAGRRAPAVVNTGWTVVSRPQVDLWYHGLAVVGFGEEAGITLYHPGYVERVRVAKQALGVYPTALDRAAEEIKRDLDSDRVFQSLHFLPLYFPAATPEEMLQGLAALTAGSILDSGNVAIETVVGLGFAAREFSSGEQRRVLGRFVGALQEEWRQFFRDYWADSLAMSQGLQHEIQSGWDKYAGGPLSQFLSRHNLDSGRIFVSPVLGPEGRSVEEDRSWGRENAVAVSMLSQDDPIASVSAAVREMCMTVIDGRVLYISGNDGQRPMKIVSNAAVRCGALLLEQGHSELLPLYQRAFLGTHGTAVSEAQLGTAFENAYAVDSTVIELLRARLDPAVVVGETDSRLHWSVRLKPQVDLWYHALAIVGVDREELLSRYDHDYAATIARAKQDRDIGATRLDSLAEYFRSQFRSKSEFRLLDQLPLFFEDATPEQMLSALAAVAERQAYRRDKVSPEARTGAAVAAQAFDRSNLRRVLRRYVDALEREWEVFYRDYWTETVAADSTRRSELNRFWATTVEPRLNGFLAGRALDGGTIVVSSAVGPEGRLYMGDPSRREDNQVVVWSPPGSSPRDPAYRVVKEICYSVVAPALEDLVEPKVETISLRMAAAVRCGALVLDRYAPILAAGYRRAMMMGVGADTATATVSRFEERFALEPEILGALRSEIGRP